MNGPLGRLQAQLAERSPRERWLMVLAACVMAILLVYTLAIAPLRAQLAVAASRAAALETELALATRMAADIRRLQAELAAVESRIQPGEATNLFATLETLASQAQVKERLESIKPKQPSGNKSYPETRVEVSLKGATLEQTIQFLHRIETAPAHLIVRSIRMRVRPDGSKLLDVVFSVSSFTRA